ncbi:hypothetical protein EYF80_054618 [Liparis tanakae]|uniref:Uncharacterized protein n=1 Tax=Liparis tanakae TaxID=230148 RepID=A0A4Z2F2U8_9TELE|nr:hypothetical protein EYF80_054618 [Liparis tanakae]
MTTLQGRAAAESAASTPAALLSSTALKIPDNDCPGYTSSGHRRAVRRRAGGREESSTSFPESV